MNEPVLPEGVWYREPLGHGYRDWLTGAHRYTQYAQFRDSITAAINTMVWYPPVGQLPWSPGMVLSQIVREANLRLVGGLGVSDTPIAIPEDAHLARIAGGTIDFDDLHPDVIASYIIVGVRQLTAQGWWISYWLDKGTEVCGVALETQTVDRPVGLSTLCALHRHHQCPGSSRREDTRVTCSCDCGCTGHIVPCDSGGDQ